jgi:hypothetical protein
MLKFTTLSGLLARTTSRTSSPHRSSRTRFNLETLEGRELMSGIAQVPVLQPPGVVPPNHISPPHTSVPPSSV